VDEVQGLPLLCASSPADIQWWLCATRRLFATRQGVKE
jgi:hypothetical protein